MKTAQTTTDLVRTYLREIGRVPLLTHEQEILYGKQVQRSTALQGVREYLAAQLDREPTLEEWVKATGVRRTYLNLPSRYLRSLATHKYPPVDGWASLGRFMLGAIRQR